MHEYDIALKSVLRRLSGNVLAELTGFAIARWHNVELPEVRSYRVDMLGETADGKLVHIELQSTNDPHMAFRMAEYSLAIYRAFHRMPEQVVLYFGELPMRMDTRFSGPHSHFDCRMADIRQLDGDRLLASERLEDNVIAILMRLADRRSAVRLILRRIAVGETGKRDVALAELMILAGLRKLGTIVEQEVAEMPILDDIMNHDSLGPKLRRAIELGRNEGLVEGYRREQAVIFRQIEKRFGPVPASLRDRLEALSPDETEQVALRLLDAKSPEDLLV
jgi:hypothetical protein